MLLAHQTIQIVLSQLAGRDAIMLNIRAACPQAAALDLRHCTVSAECCSHVSAELQPVQRRCFMQIAKGWAQQLACNIRHMLTINT